MTAPHENHDLQVHLKVRPTRDAATFWKIVNVTQSSSPYSPQCSFAVETCTENQIALIGVTDIEDGGLVEICAA